MNSVFIPPEEENDVARHSRRSRRLRRHLKRRQDGELNIVSMIDVFAVLVFFLLVGSSISAGRMHALKLDIPKVGSETVTKPQEQPLLLTVTLLDDALIVSDRTGTHGRLPNKNGGYDRETLVDILATIKAANPEESRLTLRVTADIAYERIVAVMDAIREYPHTAADAKSGELFPLISVGDAALEEGGA